MPLQAVVLDPLQGLQLPLRPPATIIFGFAKNRCTHIFFVLYSVLVSHKFLLFLLFRWCWFPTSLANFFWSLTNNGESSKQLKLLKALFLQYFLLPQRFCKRFCGFYCPLLHTFMNNKVLSHTLHTFVTEQLLIHLVYNSNTNKWVLCTFFVLHLLFSRWMGNIFQFYFFYLSQKNFDDCNLINSLFSGFSGFFCLLRDFDNRNISSVFINLLKHSCLSDIAKLRFSSSSLSNKLFNFKIGHNSFLMFSFQIPIKTKLVKRFWISSSL